MLADFREHLKNERIRVDDEAFKKESDFIRAMIRFRIDEAVFGTVEAQRHLINADPQAQVAISMFGEAQKLTEGRPPSAHARCSTCNSVRFGHNPKELCRSLSLSL